MKSVVAAIAMACAGCTGGVPLRPAPAAPAAVSVRRAPSGKVAHVVIIIQENRSFNNLFYGYPGATTATYGRSSKGRKIKLLPIGLATKWGIEHSSGSFFSACNGTGRIPGTNCRMNGFDQEFAGCGLSVPCPITHPPFAYVPHSETAPYFAIAKQYVLADEMFASNFDASSFISHQYIISGQAESAVNFPGGAWGCEGGSRDLIAEVGKQRQIPHGYEVACWNPTTLGDELDAAGISWAYYAVSYSGYPGIWSAYQAIDHIYDGTDWAKDGISPPSQFLTDVKRGKLRSVSWVTPTCADSDHAGCSSSTGPSWVTSLVNAVGESKYWDSTAIFIFCDDYGGWYDPVAPKMVDYDGLGFRLPMLIVSPYAKKGYVSHVDYEHGSILKFVEDQFGLLRLAASDTRATSPQADAFDFSQPPRTFVEIKAPHDADYFLHQPPDYRMPDWE